MRSSFESRQFIFGSEERPVSMAKICDVNSSKHSSSESNPDIEPNTENHGVQACAGIITPLSGSISRIIFKISLLSNPTMGRPSECIFQPRDFKISLNFSTEERFL